MTVWIIVMICFFFTVWTIIRPNVMWSILAAVSWMLMMWCVLTYDLFTEGDFGEQAFISICIGAAAFVLIYTIRDDNKKRRGEREKSESRNKPIGAGESAGDYYDRLNRLTHP